MGNQPGFLWVDFCCIEQDDKNRLLAGVKSLIGYISLCDALLIPSPEVPAANDRTIDRIAGSYGKRAWTLLESMSFFAVRIYSIGNKPACKLVMMVHEY
jgi:hypothetical protein